MTVKVLYPARLRRSGGQDYLEIATSNGHGMHSAPVYRVDELEDTLKELCELIGRDPSEFFFTTVPGLPNPKQELLKETKQELSMFHVDAMLRLKETLGYEKTEDLLTLLNGAKIRIDRYRKRLEELGEKLDEDKD